MVLLDAETGTTLQTLSVPPKVIFKSLTNPVQDGVYHLAFSPDGRWLVAACRSGMLHRWDLQTQPPTRTSWEGHPAEITQIAFSPDGTAFYSLVVGQQLKRWLVADWKETCRFDQSPIFFRIHPAGWLACQVHREERDSVPGRFESPALSTFPRR